MPRTPAQKLKRKEKRLASKASKASSSPASSSTITGGGAYRPAPKPFRRLHGKGGFWSDAWEGVKSVASKVPEAISLYKSIAPLLSGFGEYRVDSNSFLPGKMPRQSMDSGFPTNQPPIFASSQPGSDIVFSHREYVADILSSETFVNRKYVLNPGNTTLFPWFNRLARLYEEFQFLGLVLEYKATSATAVGTTSSAMGSVIMMTDYDCEDDSATNKRNMEAAEFSCAGQPFTSFIHPVECDPKRNVLPRQYIVPDINVVGDAPGDPRLSIPGVFNIATTGQQATGTAIGELWVSYHVRLSRPISESVSAPLSTLFNQHLWGTTMPSMPPTVDGSSGVGPQMDYSMLSGSGANTKLTLQAGTSHVGSTFVLAIQSLGPSTPTSGFIAPTGNVYATPLDSTTLVSDGYNYSTLLPNTSPVQSGTACNNSSSYGTNCFNVVCTFRFNAPGDRVEVFIPNSGHTTTFDMYVAPMNIPSSSDRRSRSNNKAEETRKQIQALTSRLAALEQKKDEVVLVNASSSPGFSSAMGVNTLKGGR